MKKILLTSAILIFFIGKIFSQAVFINIGSTILETNTIYTSTQLPWELKWGPDDQLWMTTREGSVYRVDPVTGNATRILDHTAAVWQSNESGMLGMVFHPDFANNPYVYIAYTYSGGGGTRERLSRFTYSNSQLSAETILVDNGDIVANTYHNGSRLLMLPDNTILMTTGDAGNTATAQDMGSLNSKILRVNLNGTIPSDNPFPNSLIYTLGHRNPQGLMLHPNGRVYSTEHGPDVNDEFQVIEPGRNYGWPNVQGFCDNDVSAAEIDFCADNNVKEPLASWNPAPGTTWAPNDLVWYSDASIPDFDNSILVVFLKTQKLRRIRLNASGDAITSQTDFFENQWGRLRDITTGPDGTIYIATNTSPFRIISIKSSAPVPVTVSNYVAVCRPGRIELKWTTRQELNSKQFSIYRSTDARNYSPVSTIPTRAVGGNSTMPIHYVFTDQFAFPGIVYYKLLSEDLDGSTKDYGVVKADCNSNSVNFRLSANPAHAQATLYIDGLVASPLNIIVHNITGQELFSQRTTGSIALPVHKWPPGLYIVSASTEQKEMLYREKLVLQ